MRVTLLGTGTAIPTGDRFQSGALVESADRSRRILVDCGSGVPHRLAETGAEYDEVDAVVVTHTHLDHVADLPSLVKARVLDGCPELRVYGPPDTDEVLDDLLAVDDLRERAEVTVREVGGRRNGRKDDGATFEVAGFAVTAREADHSKPTFGYRVEDGGEGNAGAVTFSGDTVSSATIADLADGSAALVHDCAHPDGASSGDHATPSGLAEALAGREIGTVYLTHLYPDTRGKEGAMAATVADRFDGEVRIGNDLTTFEV